VTGVSVSGLQKIISKLYDRSSSKDMIQSKEVLSNRLMYAAAQGVYTFKLFIYYLFICLFIFLFFNMFPNSMNASISTVPLICYLQKFQIVVFFPNIIIGTQFHSPHFLWKIFIVVSCIHRVSVITFLWKFFIVVGFLLCALLEVRKPQYNIPAAAAMAKHSVSLTSNAAAAQSLLLPEEIRQKYTPAYMY
jgi:hypothetical protein